MNTVMFFCTLIFFIFLPKVDKKNCDIYEYVIFHEKYLAMLELQKLMNLLGTILKTMSAKFFVNNCSIFSSLNFHRRLFSKKKIRIILAFS
jgi:hypothetical protein